MEVFVVNMKIPTYIFVVIISILMDTRVSSCHYKTPE